MCVGMEASSIVLWLPGKGKKEKKGTIQMQAIYFITLVTFFIPAVHKLFCIYLKLYEARLLKLNSLKNVQLNTK